LCVISLERAFLPEAAASASALRSIIRCCSSWSYIDLPYVEDLPLTVCVFLSNACFPTVDPRVRRQDFNPFLLTFPVCICEYVFIACLLS
jgi:hypothetical protein